MFGVGGTEVLLILAVALVVLGPKSLPQLARTLGKALSEFRRVSTDFQRTLNTEIELEDHTKRKKDVEVSMHKAEVLRDTKKEDACTQKSAEDSVLQKELLVEGPCNNEDPMQGTVKNQKG